MQCPGRIDLGAVGDQPASDDRLGEARAVLARRRRAEIAEPGKSLKLLRSGAVRSNRCEVEIGERQGLAANRELARQERGTTPAVALHMVPRDRRQLERLARGLQPGEERTPGELADDVAFSRRAPGTHGLPLSASMLAA